MKQKAMELIRVPLKWLEASSANVRRAEPNEEAMAELRASILAHGLLHPLIVEQKASNRAAVIGGGRRLAALQQLADVGAWPEGQPVPCVVVSGEHSMQEISLAENSGRERLHPVDQAEAFLALREAGATDKELARRFGTSPRTVQRRLRIARAAPQLLDKCRDGWLSLAALEAAAQDPDHELQVKAVENAAYQHDTPTAIYNYLVGQRVPKYDPLVRFVTLDAYRAQGGTLVTIGGADYVRNRPLLESLALDKLEKAAQLERKKGWHVRTSLNDAPHALILWQHRNADTPDDVGFQWREGCSLHLSPDWNGKIERTVLRAEPPRAPADSALGKGTPRPLRRDLIRMRMHLRRPALASRPGVARDLLLMQLSDRIHDSEGDRPRLLGVGGVTVADLAAKHMAGKAPESVAAADAALEGAEEGLLAWREHRDISRRWKALRAMGEMEKSRLLACCIARMLEPHPPEELEPALAELGIDWEAEFDPGLEVLGRYTTAQLLEIAGTHLPTDPKEQWLTLQARGGEAVAKHLPPEASQWKGLASLKKGALAAVLAEWIATERASDGRSPWIPDEIAVGVERS